MALIYLKSRSGNLLKGRGGKLLLSTASTSEDMYAVIVNAGPGVYEAWRSQLDTITQNDPDYVKYPVGATVYLFALVHKNNLAYYNISDTWEQVGTTGDNDNYLIYRTGSVTVVDGSTPDGAAKNVHFVSLTPKTFTITLGGTGVYWTSNSTTVTSRTYQYGDYLSASGNVLTCKMGSSTGAVRWMVTANKKADTVQYAYTGTPTLLNPPVGAAEDFQYDAYGVTEALQKYKVNVKMGTGWIGLYTSTSPSAQPTIFSTGDIAGQEYAYGSRVYYYAVINTTNRSLYSYPTGVDATGSLIGTSGSNYYHLIGRIEKLTCDTTVTVPDMTPKSWTISLGSSEYVYWQNGSSTVGSMTAYTGDILTTSGSTLTCTCSSGTRWTVTAKRLVGTNQYTYTGTPKVNLPTSPVAGAQTITISGVGRTLTSHTVTIVDPGIPNAEEFYFSTTNNAQSGSVSGSTVNYGTTVYAFVKTAGSPTGVDAVGSGWTQIYTNGQYSWYRIGSASVTRPTTITPNLVYTRYLIHLGGTGIVWKNGSSTVTSMDIYHYDILTKSGATITCASSSGTRWTVTATKASDTTQYKYTGTPTCSNTLSSPVTGTITYNASGVTQSLQTYAVNITAGSGVSEVYTSENISATYGNSSGYKYPIGTEIYGFIKYHMAEEANYAVPSGWTYVGMLSNYYCYRVTNKITVTGVTNLGTYNMTLKPQLSAPSLGEITRNSDGTLVMQVHNDNSVSVTANVFWYNADTDAYINSTTVSLASYGTGNATLTNASAYNIYAKVSVSNSNYRTSTSTTSNTYTIPKLSAPILISTDVTPNDGSDTQFSYDYLFYVEVKNPNSVAVVVHQDELSDYQWIAANGTTTIQPGRTGTAVFNMDNSTLNYSIWFTASGYTESSALTGKAGQGADSGDDGSSTNV